MAHVMVVGCQGEEDATAVDLEKPLLTSFNKNDFRGGNVTFARTCFNTTNALSGIGVLSMPYALSQGGWWSLLLFFICIFICYYTGLLIQKCMDSDKFIETYPDIAQFAFGYKGKFIISVLFYIELYLVGISLLILEGDNLDKLFPDASFEFASFHFKGKQLLLCMSALLILPTTWLRNLSFLAYFSVVGVFASVILLASLFWAGVAGTGFHAKGKSFSLSGLPTSLGLYFVCFSGHAVFPTIYSSMKGKTRFPKVLQISFMLCTLNYGLVAILGYLMYGEELQSQVTLNLPPGKLYSNIAIYATLFNPLAKYALTVTPIAMAIEKQVSCHESISISILVRTMVLVSTVIVALLIPFFGYVMAFIGSFLSIMVSVVLPCLCYLRIFKGARKFNCELVGIVCILICSVLTAIFGTCYSVRYIIFSL